MSVTFILGRAGAGKTRYCLDGIQAALAQTGDSRRLLLLVPEQASFQMERTLATRAPGGGYWRAEVLSFSRLAQRVFDQTGPPPAVLSPQGRRLALRVVVARAGARLGALRRAAATPGFIRELDRLIEEWIQEGVAPQALAAAAEQVEDRSGARKARVLAALYADYCTWLGPDRIDSAGRLDVLRQRLDRVTWLCEASVWVDGFAGLTGQETETLVELARRVRDVSITLLLDPASRAVADPRSVPDTLGFFRRTEATYQRLRGRLAEAGVDSGEPVLLVPTVPPRFARSPELAALEAGFAAPGRLSSRGSSGVPSSVSICECRTHRDELHAAARWIRTRIADGRGALRFRDFAVIARNLEPLAEWVAEVFADYEIPYFLDRRRPLRAHPLSRLLPAVLDAIRADADVLTMVRLLRTRLLPLARDEAEQLENVIVRHSIRGLEYWRRSTWELGRAGEEVPAFAAQRAAVVAAVASVVELAARGGGATGAEWAVALYEVVERLGVPARLAEWMAAAREQRRWESAETHRLAWSTLTEVLQDLHDVAADLRLPATEVRGILVALLDEATLGLAPPTVDQVLVSSIERSRHPDIKHAWVLAFNEGIFPAPPPDDLLLSTGEREALARAGLPAPASRREDILGERLLAYIALTRPSESLTISYATASEEGAERLPSALLAEVLRALPDVRPSSPPADPPPVHVNELARAYLLVRRDESRQLSARRHERLCAALRAVPARAGPLDWLLRGTQVPDDAVNRPTALGNFRRPRGARPPVVWEASPSEIETYLQCPFQHLARFGLRLEPGRGPRPLRWDLGDLAHAILADVTRAAMQEPGGVRSVSEPRWNELLAAVVDAFWQREPVDQKKRRPDLAFTGGLLTAFLRDVVQVQAERWRRGTFEPLACEQAFHPTAGRPALPSLTIALTPEQRVDIRGKIDRIDVCRQADRLLVVVYDYKSGGAKPLRAPFLTGQRLQLLLYLLAAEQGLTDGPPVEPAGVLLAPLFPDLDVLDNAYAVEAASREQTMYLYRPRGLVTEAAARRLDDHLSPQPSPVAHLRLRKDGGFHRQSDAISDVDFAARRELACETVRLAAEGVTRGCIDIAPLVEDHQLACRACDFLSLCRFDRAYNRPRAAVTALPQLVAPDSTTGDTG